jgi:hypothetical protein
MEVAPVNKTYRPYGHMIFSCQYHVIFCPKYHRKVLNNVVDASFNIALRPIFEEGIDQLRADRDAYKGKTDIPKEAAL